MQMLIDIPNSIAWCRNYSISAKSGEVCSIAQTQQITEEDEDGSLQNEEAVNCQRSSWLIQINSR